MGTDGSKRNLMFWNQGLEKRKRNTLEQTALLSQSVQIGAIVKQASTGTSCLMFKKGDTN